MLARRLRRRPKIDPTFIKCLVFAGQWRIAMDQRDPDCEPTSLNIGTMLN